MHAHAGAELPYAALAKPSLPHKLHPQVLSSFKYVLPQTRALRLRLAGCFLLVALERCVNLAVPLLYKHMVDTLSKVGKGTAMH